MILPHLIKNGGVILKEVMSNNPLASINEINQILKENGCIGMSLRDKVIVLHKQKSLI